MESAGSGARGHVVHLPVLQYSGGPSEHAFCWTRAALVETSGLGLESMSPEKPHISVCICTYKRPQFLKRLLQGLAKQDTGGLFTYSTVVADNDHALSAEPVVREFTATSDIRVTYCVEPRQNIALARNKAVENAEGDLVAFIDDDEFPATDWLLHLFNARLNYGVDGVLGPVKPYYECPPPDWVKKGGFFERPCYATGY